TDWNLTDGGMMYHDRECVDCEQLFIKDTNDSALVKAVSEQLRFTVGSTLGNSEHLITATGQCYKADNFTNLEPFRFPNNFKIDITGTVTVE
ncbi:hypothetical protein MNBD_GAMMA24-2825, partial [hydrothermal vent metagenome]